MSFCESTEWSCHSPLRQIYIQRNSDMKGQDGNYWIQRALVVVLFTLTLLDHQVLVSTYPTAERNNDATFNHIETNYPYAADPTAYSHPYRDCLADSDDSPEGTGLVVPEKRGRNSWG
ncbi:hypothetical protein EG68_06883 [Paragonimus skrjabini miyazakii]|uniref:Uncharacterized protein n=1 Tax=Paragonimus skrjabini miyazakii TaxID=59628 RepID=A0A8S9YWX0_9TREM|nr:hypothetical protein EG68_06883 [Paragonimus skrjabini miyazakii]